MCIFQIQNPDKIRFDDVVVHVIVDKKKKIAKTLSKIIYIHSVHSRLSNEEKTGYESKLFRKMETKWNKKIDD